MVKTGIRWWLDWKRNLRGVHLSEVDSSYDSFSRQDTFWERFPFILQYLLKDIIIIGVTTISIFQICLHYGLQSLIWHLECCAKVHAGELATDFLSYIKSGLLW